MANKKARRRHAAPIEFNLAPGNRPLTTSDPKKRKTKRKSSSLNDDTPKAFKRLLSGPPRSGLDNGDYARMRNTSTRASTTVSTTEDLKSIRSTLKIQPDESLRDFSRRVDAAIPIKFPKGEDSIKALKQKPPKPKPQKGAESDVNLSEEEDLEGLWEDFKDNKRKRGRARSPDPWEVLKEKKGTPRFGEVAEAPPQLKKPRQVFKVKDGARVDVESVPRSVGSLKKREELAGERESVIKQYREMMEMKRERRAK